MNTIERSTNQPDPRLNGRGGVTETEKGGIPDRVKHGAPLYTPAPPKAPPGNEGVVKLSPPTWSGESERSLNLQALLLILKGLIQVRDAKLSMRQLQQSLSVENSRNQISEMQKGMGWMIASAVLTGLAGIASVTVGVRCLFKNFQASREITGLQAQKKDFELPNVKYSKGKEGEKIEFVKSPDTKKLMEANQIKIDQLNADINSRNAFMQTMNGITQTLSATGNAVTSAGKAQVDISVKQAELEALLARNQKEMTQASAEQLDAMIQQIQRAIAENLQSSTQGFKAAANV